MDMEVLDLPVTRGLDTTNAPRCCHGRRLREKSIRHVVAEVVFFQPDRASVLVHPVVDVPIGGL